jgi:hypothetical protein
MEGAVMGLIDQLQGNGNESPTKVYALVFIITFITFAVSIILLWAHFLPKMEDAAEDTDRILGESKQDKSIIQKDAIPKIKVVYALYLICFGILDSILALMVWKSKVPKSKESVIKASANSYVFVRWFIIFIITLLTITALIGSDYDLILNLFYLSLVIFSIVSLFFIIYLKRKILTEKFEKTTIFKIPD